MSIALKTLFAAVAIGLVMPGTALADNKETEGTPSETSCHEIVKAAHKAFDKAKKTANDKYEDAVDAANFAYIKAIRLPSGDEEAAKAAKAAAIASALAQKNAELETAYLALSRAVASCPKEAPVVTNPTNPKEVRACVKEVQADVKADIKSIRESYKALKKTRVSRDVLKAAKREMNSKIKDIKKAEKLAKKSCKI